MNNLLMSVAVNSEGPKMGHMKPWKRVLLVLVPMVLAAILATVLYVVFWGLPVSGAPDPKDVQSVSVKYGEEPGGAVEYTDAEKIKGACGLLGDLNYEPFTQASEEDEVIVTITYNMKDGSRMVAAANAGTGWWQGKAIALKQEGVFVSLAEGLFPKDQ